MAGFSDYLEAALLNEVLTNTGYTSPTTIYVALYTTAPTDAGGGTEVSGGSYARTSAAFSVTGTSPATGANTGVITFPTASGSWGTVVAAGLFDASTSGNMLAWNNLTASKTIGNGDIFRFDIGALTVSLD